MSTLDYGSLRTAAQQLIDMAGGPVVILRAGAPAPGTNSWDVGDPVLQRIEGRAVRDEYSLKERESTLVDARDAKLYVSTDGVDSIRTSDRALFGGRVYSVVSCDEISPDGSTSLLYILQVREN